VGHGPRRGDVLDGQGDGVRLEDTDPDGQDLLVARVLQDDDRHLGDRVHDETLDLHFDFHGRCSDTNIGAGWALSNYPPGVRTGTAGASRRRPAARRRRCGSGRIRRRARRDRDQAPAHPVDGFADPFRGDPGQIGRGNPGQDGVLVPELPDEPEIEVPNALALGGLVQGLGDDLVEAG